MNNEASSLHDLQKEVDQWITTTGVRYFNELTNLAILTEEVGELARIIARRYGEQSEKGADKGPDPGDEMADEMWALLCLAKGKHTMVRSPANSLRVIWTLNWSGGRALPKQCSNAVAAADCSRESSRMFSVRLWARKPQQACSGRNRLRAAQWWGWGHAQ